METNASRAVQWGVSEKAALLHFNAIVCDLTLPWGPGYENKDTVLDRYRSSGIDFISLTVGSDWVDLNATMHNIADTKLRLRAESDKYVFVKSVDDIERAKAENKLALGFHFQGSEGLNGDRNMVHLFYELGVRHMLLAYNSRNRAADGCHERTDCGLSRYGVRLIEEMNRAGMILDLSHTGYRTTMEAMEVSEAPVMFSHSNAYGLKAHPRNIKDDQIKTCARKGGLVGINGVGHFLGDNDDSVGNIVRHIDYVAELVGPQHIGLGMDFVYYLDTLHRRFLANPDKFPEGYPKEMGNRRYAPPEQLPRVTEALLGRNYPEKDIRGILGENFLRLARQVWK
jgi:membrane dipeptidase